MQVKTAERQTFPPYMKSQLLRAQVNRESGDQNTCEGISCGTELLPLKKSTAHFSIIYRLKEKKQPQQSKISGEFTVWA